MFKVSIAHKITTCSQTDLFVYNLELCIVFFFIELGRFEIRLLKKYHIIVTIVYYCISHCHVSIETASFTEYTNTETHCFFDYGLPRDFRKTTSTVIALNKKKKQPIFFDRVSFRTADSKPDRSESVGIIRWQFSSV